MRKKKKEKMSENDQMKQQLSERERKMYYRKRNKQYQNYKLKQQLIERKRKSNYRERMNETRREHKRINCYKGRSQLLSSVF